VPLSEHEQHLLEQMEQALYAEDPKFASQMPLLRVPACAGVSLLERQALSSVSGS